MAQGRHEVTTPGSVQEESRCFIEGPGLMGSISDRWMVGLGWSCKSFPTMVALWFFMEGMDIPQNGLTWEVVEPPSLEVLKRCVDVALKTWLSGELASVALWLGLILKVISNPNGSMILWILGSAHFQPFWSIFHLQWRSLFPASYIITVSFIMPLLPFYYLTGDITAICQTVAFRGFSLSLSPRDIIWVQKSSSALHTPIWEFLLSLKAN